MRIAVIAPIVLLALAVLGCETPLDRAFGRSQRAYLERSIENPEAGMQEDAAAPRVDGVSAGSAMDDLRRHEAEDRPQYDATDTMINVEIGN